MTKQKFKATNIKAVTDEHLESAKFLGGFLGTYIERVSRELAKHKEKIMLDTIYEYRPDLKELPIEELSKVCLIKIPEKHFHIQSVEELWIEDKHLLTFYPPDIKEKVEAEGDLAVKYIATIKYEKHV